jgi:putative membrane protein
MTIRPALRGPAIFAALYMALASALAFRASNLEFVFYALVMLVLIGTVWWLDTRVRLSTFSLWCLSIWGLAHMMGGTVPIPAELTEPGEQQVLYSLRIHPWAPKYDQVVHAFGFFTTTLVAWRALNAAVGGVGGRGGVSPGASLPPTFGPIFAAMMVSMGLSAMNEIIEFVATLIFTETNVGGYVNTGWDLVSNLTGCVIAGVLIRATARPSPPRPGRDHGPGASAPS